MEGNSGSYTDKTRVLDIKPLRTLRPIFPSGNQAPPFVCAPPFGPFPSGFSSFYPFTSSQVNDQTPDLSQAQNPPQRQPQIPPQPLVPHQQQPQAPPQQQLQNLSERSLATTPLRPFRSPVTTSNGEIEPEGSTVRRKTPKKRQLSNFESGITVAERDNGNRELVMSVLMRFDALRRRLAQLEDAEDAVNGIIKRPDLKAGSTCMSRGVRTNTKKRPGVVPGVEIGDVFFFRFEMCLVGLHSPSMAGIDYLLVKGESGEEPIATSIVSSGYYDNDEGNPDVLVYTGQGGGNADKEKQTSDQKLERGNLALEKSLVRNSPVRVIRGLKEASQSAKIYVYDGLYEIKESWVEKGKLGHNTFKYKLVRAPGQPPAFATWIAIQKWKAGLPSREGLILSDLTSGVESIGVSLVNDVDAENGPPYFTYSTTVNYSESFKLTQPSVGCHCSNSCKPGNLDCHCIRQNGGDFPYCGNGVLVSRKSLIHECSPSCPCSPCKNKVTQMGIKVKLEVFKTVNRGWGLRSWDPIRAGSFICIYAGEAKDKSKVVQQTMADDDYTFDTTRVYTPFRWNYELGLADEDASEEMSEEPELPLPLIINAKNAGNVARFMNHSCSPNVFWQPVSYENNGQLYLQVAFFAMSHIPPMTELTYDYGVTRPSGTQNGNTLYGRKKCFCGSEFCRGSFG
ncbi:Histone-lysine N-methyltransferase [Hirschfeldia incana]|nr:Histone-lysine N-methyltransferase [Hirschfeldia incana]